MLTNISHSKYLDNRLRRNELNKKRSDAVKCNHCGGAFRNSGDMIACIMCSRESGHICDNCTHATTDALEKNKKSA